jgi:hypothetical protein
VNQGKLAREVLLCVVSMKLSMQQRLEWFFCHM